MITVWFTRKTVLNSHSVDISTKYLLLLAKIHSTIDREFILEVFDSCVEKNVKLLWKRGVFDFT